MEVISVESWRLPRLPTFICQVAIARSRPSFHQVCACRARSCGCGRDCPRLPATARDCGRRRLPGPGRSLDLSNTCRIYSNALIFANAFAIWAITILTGAHRSAEPTTNKHTPPVI